MEAEMLDSELRGHNVNLAHGLADNLDVADNRILNLVEVVERLKISWFFARWPGQCGGDSLRRVRGASQRPRL